MSTSQVIQDGLSRSQDDSHAFWKRILKAMPRLEVIYVSTPPGSHWNETSTPVPLMRLIMEKYHTTLKCLYAGYESFNGESGKKNVVHFCQQSEMNALDMLEYLSFFTIGRVDSQLDTRPVSKRLKDVVGPFYGLEGVCLSPASQTLMTNAGQANLPSSLSTSQAAS